MTTFHSNILNIYGEKGISWLAELPQLVVVIASMLDLRDLKEVINLTCNYVLSGFQGDKPIILQLGLDNEALAREAFALRCFEGRGAVNVLAEDDGMLLLERVAPGTSLKSYFPDREQKSIEIACGVMQKLNQANIPVTHNFPHVKDWSIHGVYLKKARKLRDQLFKTAGPDVLLHGDLHHDNILQNGDDWVVINPKGAISEPAYEGAAFIRNPILELLTHDDAPNIILNRITRFASILDIPAKRIFDWCFVQAVLSWVWALEDGCDIIYFEQMIKVFNKIYKGRLEDVQ
jgi:streptomycin 6-kinase